jgi:hypothetical protein
MLAKTISQSPDGTTEWRLMPILPTQFSAVPSGLMTFNYWTLERSSKLLGYFRLSLWDKAKCAKT